MIRRSLYSLLLILFLSTSLYGQSDSVEKIKELVPQSDVEMKIYFLAADEFKGRDTGSPHIDIAGRYIATWFMTNGIKPLPGHDNYYQPIPFNQMRVPEDGTVTLGDLSYSYGSEFIILNTPRGEFEGPITVLEHGIGEELDDADVEGKIVVVRPGAEGQVNPQQWFMSASQKNQALQEMGALAVVELYDNQQLPWQVLVNFLNQDRLEIADEEEELESEEDIPHIWINSSTEDLHSIIAEMSGADGSISVTGAPAERVYSNNVIGYIEGTNPDLRDEYLMLGAHYDHVGIDESREGNYIYNGARDNAVGTAGIMLAARYLAQNPPERSVIFAAWTAEEMGLLGSGYFADNPMVPLDQIVYKLNIDGAGYNDTTKVMVIGLERTEAADDLKSAAEAFGLEAIPDPVPEQNLFNRSDNASFARKGIPAPTYSLGMTDFDEEINRYYHTVEDEPHTLDYPYITRYLRSFLLAAEKIANAPVAPFWSDGDPFKQLGLELYGREVEVER